MRISKTVMQLSALNKEYATLEEQLLKKNVFVYSSWMELADRFPAGSRRQKEIRKRAAKVQRERTMGNG